LKAVKVSYYVLTIELETLSTLPKLMISRILSADGRFGGCVESICLIKLPKQVDTFSHLT
jgi:hypothetical protein